MGKSYVAKKVESASGPYLRVQTRSNSDPAQLRAFLGDAAGKLLAGLKPLATKTSGEATLLLDPRTLDTKEMNSTRRAEFTMKIPQIGSFPMSFAEVKELKEVPSK